MMNATTATAANEILDAEINCLAALNESDLADYLQWMDGVHAQVPDPEPEDMDGDDMSEFDGEPEPREDHFRDDVDADADALAGAGYGTDEDYGYYGGEDY